MIQCCRTPDFIPYSSVTRKAILSLRSGDVTGFSLLAYFDPGPGSLLLQAIIGGSAGALVFGRYLVSEMLMRFRGPKADQAK